MFYYMQIDADNIGKSLLQSSEIVDLPYMIARPTYDEHELGKYWDGNDFSALAGAMEWPRLVVTGIASDVQNGFVASSDLTDITVPVGATVTFHTELYRQDSLLKRDESFRSLIRSRDGRERVLRMTLAQGAMTFSIRFEDSRIWELTEAMINADLPSERRMRFKGIKMFVVEA